MSAGLNGASIALCVISLIFFLVGCIAYSDDGDVIKNTAWFTSSDSGSDTYFGLKKVYFTFGSFDASVSYGSDSCPDNTCDKCDQDGKGALGLNILAIIFTTITVALSGALLASANKGMQIANIFMSFIAAVCSLISIGLFMGDCYNAINNDDDDYYDDSGLDLKWGSGSILTLIGMLMMWIVVVLQIAATAMAPAS